MSAPRPPVPTLPTRPTTATAGMTLAETLRAWYEHCNVLQTAYAAALTDAAQADYNTAAQATEAQRVLDNAAVAATQAQRVIDNAARVECHRLEGRRIDATEDATKAQREYNEAILRIDAAPKTDAALIRMFFAAAIEAGKTGPAVSAEVALQLAAYRRMTAAPFTVPV